MAKEALAAIKDLTKEELTAKMRSGEFVPPKGRQEREEFFKFVDMPKEQRESYLSDESTSTGSQDKPETGKPEETPWYKELGYEDDTKAKEAHKTLLDLTSRLQSTVDSLNAKEGKRGNELKRLTDEKQRLEKELGDYKKTSIPDVVKPVRPVRPKPSDFENGAFDEKYIEAVGKYEMDTDAYLEKHAEYVKESTKREILETLPKQTVSTPETKADSELDKLFTNDIPEFQKRFNLVTTVPIKSISDNYNVADPKSNATPQERAIAQNFLKSVPAADLEAYAKVKSAVEIAYDFSSGVPQSRYKTIEGALFDNGMIGEGKQFNVVTPIRLSAEDERAAREKAQAKNSQDVSTLPASSVAGADKKLSDFQTTDEKKNRYRNLLSLYNVALNEGKGQQFEKTPEFAEYVQLRKEVVGSKPSWLK